MTQRSTVGEIAEGAGPWALHLRRLGLALLAVLVAADLSGLLGTRTGSKTVEGDGYTMRLLYPAFGRAGLDVTWQVRVHHIGGFSDPIVLRVTGDYFDIFESQGLHPEPSSQTRDATGLVLTFDPPSGDTFVVDYDAYVQPASQRGRHARLVLLSHGAPIAAVRFTTYLWP